MTLFTKVGTVTKDTTTGAHTQAFASELGFTASGIIFWTTMQTATGTAADANMCIGFTNGTTHMCNVSTSNDAAASSTVGEVSAPNCIAICINGTNTDAGKATCTITTNGFSLVWSATTNNQAYKINYWAFGGTDITNVAVQGTVFTGTGNRTYTTTGSFQGDILFVMGTGLGTNTANGGRAFGCFGAAMSSSKQFVSAYTADGSLVTMDTKKTQRTNKCIMAMNDIGTVLTDADFVAWTSTGFTLNHTVCDTSDAMFCMIVKGGKWDVGNFTQKTSTGTQNVPIDSTINPDTVMLSSFNATATTSVIDHSNLSIGASDGTNERSSWEGDEDNVPDAIAKSDHSETKVIRLLDEVSGGSTLLAEADVTSLATAGQFTLDWTTADATAREICFVVLGVVAAGAHFDRTASESLTITASPVYLRRVPKTASESLTISAAAKIQIHRFLTESLTASASVAYLRRVPKAISESLTISANVARMLSADRALSESLTVSGTVAWIKKVYATLNQSLTLSDSVVRLYRAIRPRSESFTIAANVARLRRIPKTLSESLTVSAAVVKLSRYFRSVSESDTVVGTVASRMRAIRPVSASLTITDTLARFISVSMAIAASLIIDAQITAAKSFRRFLSESVTVNAAVVRLVKAYRTVSASLTVDAAVVRLRRIPKTLTESLIIADSVAALRKVARSVSESAVIADTVQRAISVTRSLSESLTLADAVSTAKHFTRSIAETLTLTAIGARLYRAYRSTPQSLTINAAVTKISDFSRALSENVTISAAVTCVRRVTRILLETPVLTASVARAAKVYRTLSVSLTVSAAVARLTSFRRTVTESFIVNAAVVRLYRAIKTIAQSVVIVDVATKSQSLLRSVSESFTIAANGVGELVRLTIDVFVNESFVITDSVKWAACWFDGRGPIVYAVKKIGRFFSILPQRTARPYTTKSKFIKYDSRGEEY